MSDKTTLAEKINNVCDNCACGWAYARKVFDEAIAASRLAREPEQPPISHQWVRRTLGGEQCAVCGMYRIKANEAFYCAGARDADDLVIANAAARRRLLTWADDVMGTGSTIEQVSLAGDICAALSGKPDARPSSDAGLTVERLAEAMERADQGAPGEGWPVLEAMQGAGYPAAARLIHAALAERKRKE